MIVQAAGFAKRLKGVKEPRSFIFACPGLKVPPGGKLKAASAVISDYCLKQIMDCAVNHKHLITLYELRITL